VNIIPFQREEDRLLDTYKAHLVQDKKGQTAEDYGGGRVGYKGGKQREIDLLNQARKPLYEYLEEQ
jgi:tryptophanyl-tRNA synthetase